MRMNDKIKKLQDEQDKIMNRIIKEEKEEKYSIFNILCKIIGKPSGPWSNH